MATISTPTIKPSKEFGKGNPKADEVITPEKTPEKNTFKGGTK